MGEVITAILTDDGWCHFDGDGHQLHPLEWDVNHDRLVTHPRVAVKPETLAWIDMHDPENGDPCVVRGYVIDVVGDRLTVTEPDGTCWIWILSPATWEGREGYYVGRWPD